MYITPLPLSCLLYSSHFSTCPASQVAHISHSLRSLASLPSLPSVMSLASLVSLISLTPLTYVTYFTYLISLTMSCLYLQQFRARDVAQAVEHSPEKVGIIWSSCMVDAFVVWAVSVPTSGPWLVHQRLSYVLPCLLESAYKRPLAAYQKE